MAVNFCFLKRKEPLEGLRNKAILVMILKATGHRGTGLGPQRQGVLDYSAYTLVTDNRRTGRGFKNAYLKRAVFRSLFIIGFRIKAAC